jgi:hypothetical protein
VHTGITVEVRGEKIVSYSDLQRAQAAKAFAVAEREGKCARLYCNGAVLLECGEWPDPVTEEEVG